MSVPVLILTKIDPAGASGPGNLQNDEVTSHRQYGQTNRMTDRYKYNKTDTMKTKLKEKVKTRIKIYIIAYCYIFFFLDYLQRSNI